MARGHGALVGRVEPHAARMGELLSGRKSVSKAYRAIDTYTADAAAPVVAQEAQGTGGVDTWPIPPSISIRPSVSIRLSELPSET